MVVAKQGFLFAGEPAAIADHFKASTPTECLFEDFQKLFIGNQYIHRIHGIAFPKEFSDLFKVKLRFVGSSATKEVIWAIGRCVSHGSELEKFNLLREQYERAFLANDRAASKCLLANIESSFGPSIWLLQATLSSIQLWEGIDAARDYLQKLPLQQFDSVLQILISFIGKRIEATSVKDYLKTQLEKLVDDKTNSLLKKYLNAKLFEAWDLNTFSVPAFLGFEAQSCVIDHYEALIAVLQAAASDQTINREVSLAFERPLKVLFRRTKDRRIPPILRGIGIVPDTQESLDGVRARILESFTQGKYELCSTLCEQYLEKNPEDIAIFLLQIKAAVAGHLELPKREGALEEIPKHFSNIISATPDIYLSAYAIHSITERFYGQAWVSYLHAALAFELRNEQEDNPPLWLRDMYIRDVYVSPFSILASDGTAQTSLAKRLGDSGLFSDTLGVAMCILTGTASKSTSIHPSRYARYLARYYIAESKPQLAIECLAQVNDGTGSELIRTGGLHALAELQLHSPLRAIEAVCQAYYLNPNAASFLPLAAIVEYLSDPLKWPNHIGVPIVFSLYATFISRSKLTELYYSFEKFQSDNEIKSVADLINGPNADQRALIYYLSEIWRPEIMRQTILYTGTRSIEDERIEVCRALVELDPERSGMYLQEIKDRVKKQEISQSAQLIEQSKVYVDVESIKNTLRSQLGDSYKRYKTAAQTKSNNFLFDVADLVREHTGNSTASPANLLSKTIVLNTALYKSESDVQFDAIYAAVTREFLRGDHGLNAYLSTRIRHGKMTNRLRRAAVDERLITAKKENSDDYVPNLHWRATFSPLDEERIATIEKTLAEFAKEFDGIVDFVKNELIQISINDDFTSNEGPALFVYRTSDLERRFVQQQDQSLTSIDDLVNYCVDLLWEKTDDNLALVQDTLQSGIKARLLEVLDALAEKLYEIDTTRSLSQLHNAVARTRTETQQQLAHVIGWFQRSEVYDRADYAPDFPVQVALNILKKTNSDIANWSGAEINIKEGDFKLPGRTLDGLVDIYFDLLDNALSKSGIVTDQLKVNVLIDFDGSSYGASVRNPIGEGVASTANVENIARLREQQHAAERREVAQREGRSGFAKIRTYLDGTSFSNASLNFGYIGDDTFDVSFRFNLKERDATVITD